MVTSNALSTNNPLVQFVSTNKTAAQVLTTVMPMDDTIPQKAEGDEILTLAITPKKLTNILVIEFNSTLQLGSVGQVSSFALFQDATDGALSATCANGAVANQTDFVYFKHVMVAGTVAATTFKVRGGPSAGAVNIGVNSDPAGVRYFGGVAGTWLTITEYSA